MIKKDYLSLTSKHLLLELVRNDGFITLLEEIAQDTEQDALTLQEASVDLQNPLRLAYTSGQLAQMKKYPQILIDLANDIAKTINQIQ